MRVCNICSNTYKESFKKYVEKNSVDLAHADGFCSIDCQDKKYKRELYKQPTKVRTYHA